MADATDRRDATQRIRIGLTGLAGVLVLVLFAAAMLGLRSGDLPSASGNGSGAAARKAAADAPKDPLAELGVTPGGGADAAPAASRPTVAPTTAAQQATRATPR